MNAQVNAAELYDITISYLRSIHDLGAVEKRTIRAVQIDQPPVAIVEDDLSVKL
jgi:hypothetical protein